MSNWYNTMQKFIFQRISPSLLSFEFDENEIHTYMARFHTFDNFYANQAFGTASGFISGEREKQ